MSKKAKKRREYLKIQAIDPQSGKRDYILISSERLIRLGKRSKGQTMEAAYTLIDTVQNPQHIFEGIRWDEDERSSDVPGWRCYCKKPTNRYNFEGVQVRADPNKVFMVFVNENKVAYLWYWHTADDDDKTLPLGHEKRFKKKVI